MSAGIIGAMSGIYKVRGLFGGVGRLDTSGPPKLPMPLFVMEVCTRVLRVKFSLPGHERKGTGSSSGNEQDHERERRCTVQSHDGILDGEMSPIAPRTMWHRGQQCDTEGIVWKINKEGSYSFF